MAYTPTRLYLAQPGTGETTLYTSTGIKTIIKEIIVCNTTSSAATISLSIVPTGGSASGANRILAGMTIQANTTVTIPMSQVMNSGDFISGLQGTSSAITVTISGVTF